MVHYIYGASGTGKTHTVMQYLAIDVKNGKKAFVIVPEQETVAVERNVVSTLPTSAQLSVEVLNFSRLCNRIFRTYGGISYNFATKSAKSLVMWNTLRELSPMLEEYSQKQPTDFSLTQKMMSAVSELKAYSVLPQKLEVTCDKLDATSSLRSKLRDISLIYSAYTSSLGELFDDTADDIGKAIDILKSNNPFEGANVYLDSFAGFTKQEFDFIARIAELCDELYITLPIPTPHDISIHLDSVKQTHVKLKRSLSSIPFDEIHLTENRRTNSAELQHLNKSLWNFNAPAFSGEVCGDISVHICETPYSESDTVASEIRRAAMEGARFSEMAIILRNADKYRGILDVTLEKYGVPYFMSEKTDLMTKPLAKFLFSALAVKETNWRAQSVISHLKSGFSDVDSFDVDVFEDYVTTWNINGNKFFGERWTMNPDGYSASFTPRGESILSKANAVKEYIVPLLSLYFTKLDAASCVKDMCQATVEFLKDVRITEKVRAYCERALEGGDRKEADESMKLYSLTLNILYDLSLILGDASLTTEEFAAALQLMFTESDIGTIPTSADEVIVGSASMLRTDRIKYAFVMGLNEGEFPASVKDTGIFTDADKQILEELDLSLSADTSTKNSEELFFAYRALCSPKDKLHLSASLLSSEGNSQRQSLILDRIKKLFPTLKHKADSKRSYADRVWNTELAKELYPFLKEGDNTQEIRRMIEEHDGDDLFVRRIDIPLSQKECTVSPDILNKIFAERLSLTQSRLEKYVLCGFDYYCTYVLGLRESKRAVFQLNDIGTFIHYILEMFMKEITVDGALHLTLTDDEIEAILQKTVSNYLCNLLGKDYALSNRTKHLFDRLNKLSFMIAKNLISEFKESDFYPTYFELKVGMDAEGIKALEFELKDGSTVTLRGIADRVDTYKKDGNVYIRVVDYKTGSKEFSFEDLKEGLNTQLLIYLFSICKAQDEKKKAELGCCEGGELLPAGIQYLSSDTKTVSVESFCDSDEVDSLIQNQFARSGLLLDDADLLSAINHELDPKILTGVKQSKDGTLSGKSLVSADGFEKIYGLLSETIIRVAESMREGKANAIPLHHGDKAACRYCKMKSICRASVCKSKK